MEDELKNHACEFVRKIQDRLGLRLEDNLNLEGSSSCDGFFEIPSKQADFIYLVRSVTSPLSDLFNNRERELGESGYIRLNNYRNSSLECAVYGRGRK